MVELGLPSLKVTQERLQNLMSQGYITALEMATYHVPQNATSPVPVGEYVMACVVFYEWGFVVPSHPFLYSLLQFYGLEV
jgi:hypothetical protein